jgi:hypothetical protein
MNRPSLTQKQSLRVLKQAESSNHNGEITPPTLRVPERFQNGKIAAHNIQTLGPDHFSQQLA